MRAARRPQREKRASNADSSTPIASAIHARFDMKPLTTGIACPSRLREKSSLFAVEPLCDGGEFVLERDGLVDRRDTAGLREMREPVAQRQRAGVGVIPCPGK